MITTTTFVDSDTVKVTTTPDPVDRDIKVSNTNTARQQKEKEIAQVILDRANDALSQIQPLLAELADFDADFATAIAAGATDPGTIILDTTSLQSDLAALIAKATTEASGTQA